MRYLWTVGMAVFLPLALCAAQVIPTPMKAMKFSMGDDHRKWVSAHRQGTPQGFIYELVPEGQTIDAWKEMVAQQTMFTGAPLREFVDVWRAGVSGKDPAIQMRETILADGSIVEEYTSPAFQETAIRRFIKAEDGVYALAYHVRPSLKNEGVYKTWLAIIDGASLVLNPETMDQASRDDAGEREAVWFANFIAVHVGKDFFPPPHTTLNDAVQAVRARAQAHGWSDKMTDSQYLQALVEAYPPPTQAHGPANAGSAASP